MTFAAELEDLQSQHAMVTVKGQTGLIDGFRSVEGAGGWIRLANEDGSIIATIEFASREEVKI